MCGMRGVFVCLAVCMCVCMYGWMDGCVYGRTDMYVRMYVCMCMCDARLWRKCNKVADERWYQQLGSRVNSMCAISKRSLQVNSLMFRCVV